MSSIRRIRLKLVTKKLRCWHQTDNSGYLYIYWNNFNTTAQLYHYINTEQRTLAALIQRTRIASAGSNTTTSVRVVVLQNEPWAQSGLLAGYRAGEGQVDKRQAVTAFCARVRDPFCLIPESREGARWCVWSEPPRNFAPYAAIVAGRFFVCHGEYIHAPAPHAHWLTVDVPYRANGKHGSIQIHPLSNENQPDIWGGFREYESDVFYITPVNIYEKV